MKLAPAATTNGPAPRRMVTAGYFLTANTGLSALVGFGYWVVAARLYDASIVGRAGAAISLVMLVSAITSFELPLALNRYLARYPGRSREVLRSAYVMTAVMGLVAMVAVVGLSWAELANFGDVGMPSYLLPLLLLVWSLFVLQDGALIGLDKSKLVLTENLGFGIAKLLLLVLFAEFLPHAGIVVSWAIPLFGAVGGVTWWLYRTQMSRGSNGGREASAASGEAIDWSEVRSFVTGQYIASIFAHAAEFGPPIFVAWYYGGDAAGWFYVAWLMGTTATEMVDAFTTSLTVEGSANPDDVGRLWRIAASRALVIFVPVGLVIFVGAPELLRIFGGGYAAESATMLRLMGVAVILRIPVALFMAAARARGDFAGLMKCGGGLAAVSLLAPLVALDAIGPTVFGVSYVAALLVASAGLALRYGSSLLSSVRRP